MAKFNTKVLEIDQDVVTTRYVNTALGRTQVTDTRRVRVEVLMDLDYFQRGLVVKAALNKNGETTLGPFRVATREIKRGTT